MVQVAAHSRAWLDEGLQEQLTRVRERVRRPFDAVIAAPEEEADEPQSENALAQWRLLWREELEPDEAQALLAGDLKRLRDAGSPFATSLRRRGAASASGIEPPSAISRLPDSTRTRVSSACRTSAAV